MNKEIYKYYTNFGDKHFSKSDLWIAFGGGFPGFPTDEFIDRLAVERLSWIETSKGPRGGKGWRLTKEAVEAARKHERKLNSIIDAIKAVTNEIKPRFGSFRHNEYWNKAEIVWHYSVPNSESLSFTVKAAANIDQLRAEVVKKLNNHEQFVIELLKKEKDKLQLKLDEINGLLNDHEVDGGRKAK